MQRQSNQYTFMFALAVCAICSLAIASVSEGLKSRKELNVALDIKKNILKAVGLKEGLPKKATAKEVLSVYESKIEETVIDDNGEIVEAKKPGDIQEGEALHPLYIYKESGQAVSYCFPIIGKGLWSTLYGYFALEPDAMTVRGITFYKHGETPGLGAEIERDWFLNNFKGKKIWDVRSGALMPTQVVKGKVAGVIPEEKQEFYVDGISGATITGKGVSQMVDRWVHAYEPFLKKIRKQ